jgi:hypothetical protein
LSGGDAVDIIVTLEPCQQSRQPKKDDTCSERILKFSERCKVGRIVIGIVETGHGLRFLVEKGFQIVLLHGPEHLENIQEKIQWEPGRERALRTIDELKRLKRSNLQIIETTKLDPINQEEHKRFLRSKKLWKSQVDAVLNELVAVSKTSSTFFALQLKFPDVFPLKARKEFQDIFEALEPDKAEDSVRDAFQEFVEAKVRVALNKIRNQNIESELREAPNAK